MPQEYQLTEKGVQQAKKKRTMAKGLGEAVTFGGPWKGEEYSNMLLVTLLSKPHEPRDAHELTVETFSRPRPSETKITHTLNRLAIKGFVKRVIPSGLGFSDSKGQRVSRSHHRGFKRLRF